MKNYPYIFVKIDRDFEQALQALRSDPLFSSSKTVYTEGDKKRIASLWKNIVKPFLRLRHILRTMMWRSFFFGSKNVLVIQYTAVSTYYNMVAELQSVFGIHEEFLRQYLDDTFRENYSNIARYMYHVYFMTILLYPREYFLTLRDEVHPILTPLFYRPPKADSSINRRITLDSMNIFYFIRYRIGLLFTWIAKYGGKIMMHIYISPRQRGLIGESVLASFVARLLPGDILLTRRNWTATNLNIPGFWKHMAMYIGTGSHLKQCFPHEKLVEKFSDDTHYIIEAIGKGVQIVPIVSLTEHNDYIASLRTRFSPEKIQKALTKTIQLVGKEYDYSFNYYSDAQYVCSTLVTKAYLPDDEGEEGIHIY